MTETITHVALSPLNKAAGNRKETIFTGFTRSQFSTDNRQCLVIKAPHISDEEIVTNDIVDLISDHHLNGWPDMIM